MTQPTESLEQQEAGLYSSYRLALSILWVIVFGWWIGFLSILLIWLLHLSLLGLPLGIWLANRLSNVFFLTSRPAQATIPYPWGNLTLRPPLRAIYYLFIGSWLGLLWMLLAWFFAAAFVILPLFLWLRFDHLLLLAVAPVGLGFIPVALWMLHRTEAVITFQST